MSLPFSLLSALGFLVYVELNLCGLNSGCFDQHLSSRWPVLLQCRQYLTWVLLFGAKLRFCSSSSFSSRSSILSKSVCILSSFWGVVGLLEPLLWFCLFLSPEVGYGVAFRPPELLSRFLDGLAGVVFSELLPPLLLLSFFLGSSLSIILMP